MSEGTTPAGPMLPDAGPTTPDPLLLRLEDLRQYGTSEVEPEPWPARLRLLLALGVALAIALGAWVGLQPLLLRQRAVTTLERQLAAGEFTAAQTTLDRLAERFPEHPDLRRYRGLVALSQADWATAESELRAHAARFPDDAVALRALSYLYGLDLIFLKTPPNERDLRKGMVLDWTRLLGYSVAGIDPGLPALGLEHPALSEAFKYLNLALGNATAPDPAVMAARSALDLLVAEEEAAREAAFGRLMAHDGVNLPAFQAWTTLAALPGEELPIGPPVPPLVTPPTSNLPSLPTPGSIDPLPETGFSYPGAGTPSPGFVPPGRGGTLPGAAGSEGSEAMRNMLAEELAMPSGMGQPPRVRPHRADVYPREEGAREQTDIRFAVLLNEKSPGSLTLREGETGTMPGTGFTVTLKSISPDLRRMVIEEQGRAVYVFVKAPGTRWQWSPLDEENDGGAGARAERRGDAPAG